MYSLDYQVEKLIKEVSANRFFGEKRNTDYLREKIYEHQGELQSFAEEQARKINWESFDSEEVNQVLIKYSKLGNVGNYQNDETANLENLANDITKTNTEKMVAFARAIAPVPHGRPLGMTYDLWARI